MSLKHVDLVDYYSWLASVYKVFGEKYNNPFLQLLYLDKTVGHKYFKSGFRMSPTMVSYTLRHLKDAGLIRTRPKERKYELTKLGRTLVEELNKRSIELYRGIKEYGLDEKIDEFSFLRVFPKEYLEQMTPEEFAFYVIRSFQFSRND